MDQAEAHIAKHQHLHLHVGIPLQRFYLQLAIMQ